MVWELDKILLCVVILLYKLGIKGDIYLFLFLMSKDRIKVIKVYW